MAEHETIADIIAEMRGIRIREFQDYADRLEAAIKRERAKIEADALTVGGIVEAAHKQELSKNASKNASNFGQLGDAAKMREALEHLLHGEYRDRCEVTNIAHSALSAPPRNCDLARDWMRDLYAHFQPPASVKREMPPEWVDAVMAFCRWLVAPATEQEGGNK